MHFYTAPKDKNRSKMGKKSLKIMFFESNFTDNIEFLRENFENSIFFHVNFAIFRKSEFFTTFLYHEFLH